MADVEKSFKTMVKKGSIVFGKRQSKVSLDEGKAKAIIFSGNSPYIQELKAIADKKKIPTYISKVDSVELGALCGKSYAISTFAVIDDGGINIQHLIGKR